MATSAFSASDIDAATNAALGALAWSTPSYDDDGEFLDAADADWSDAAREQMRTLMHGFMSDKRVTRLLALLALYGVPFSPDQIGHDFILTANRHGAGFWDRDYRARPKAALDELSEIVRPHGEIGAYQSDNGALEIGY